MPIGRIVLLGSGLLIGGCALLRCEKHLAPVRKCNERGVIVCSSNFVDDLQLSLPGSGNNLEEVSKHPWCDPKKFIAIAESFAEIKGLRVHGGRGALREVFVEKVGDENTVLVILDEVGGQFWGVSMSQKGVVLNMGCIKNRF